MNFKEIVVVCGLILALLLAPLCALAVYVGGGSWMDFIEIGLLVVVTVVWTVAVAALIIFVTDRMER